MFFNRVLTITYFSYSDDFDLNPFDCSLKKETIHIHLLPKGGRKSLTVLHQFILPKHITDKVFLSKLQKILSTQGFKKYIPEIDDKNEVYCFQGDQRQFLLEILEKDYNISKNQINVHGA